MATSKKTTTAARSSAAAAKKTPAATRSTAAASASDFGKIIEKFKLPGVDVAAIVESQRKDMEALVEANRLAFEGIKALAKRRNEILKESLAEWQAGSKDSTGKGGLSKQADLAKKGVEKAIASIRELAEMEAASRSQAWKVVQDRFQENLTTVQKLLRRK